MRPGQLKNMKIHPASFQIKRIYILNFSGSVLFTLSDIYFNVKLSQISHVGLWYQRKGGCFPRVASFTSSSFPTISVVQVSMAQLLFVAKMASRQGNTTVMKPPSSIAQIFLGTMFARAILVFVPENRNVTKSTMDPTVGCSH